MLNETDQALYDLLNGLADVNTIGIRPASTIGQVAFPRIALVRTLLQPRMREQKPFAYLRYEDPDSEEKTVTFGDGTSKTGRVNTLKRKHPDPFNIWYDVRLQTMKTSDDRTFTELILKTFPVLGSLTVTQNERELVLPMRLAATFNVDEYVGQGAPFPEGGQSSRSTSGMQSHAGLPAFEKVFRYVVEGWLDVYPETAVKAILERVFEYREFKTSAVVADSVVLEIVSYSEDEP